MQDVPDTVEVHDDWIEWTYFMKAAYELSKKLTGLYFERSMTWFLFTFAVDPRTLQDILNCIKLYFE